jgi:hypothetical protein
LPRPPTRPLRTWAVTPIALVMLPLSIAGCQRRAPGPWECDMHARRVVKSAGPLPSSQAELAYQSEISRCLTTPYDRELVRCVEERGPSRRCYQEFERRLRGPDSPELPDGERAGREESSLDVEDG